jgi:two-component system chemotaxis response regulator CheY
MDDALPDDPPFPLDPPHEHFNRWLHLFRGAQGQGKPHLNEPPNSKVGKRKLKKAIRCLLVDDDPALRMLYRGAIPESRFFFDEAATGREALTLLRSRKKYALVLTDLDHPEMNGFEMIKAIRLMKRFKTLPIVVVSARCTKPEDVSKARAAGATAILAKPFELDALLTIMHKLVKPAKKRPAKRRKK